MKESYYRIYTRRIAVELRKKGFNIIKTEVNERFPQYDVYLFYDSPSLREAFSKITQAI